MEVVLEQVSEKTIENQSQVVTETQSQAKQELFGGKKHVFKKGNQHAKGHVRLFGGIKPKLAVSHTVKFCRLAEKDLESYYKRLKDLALNEALPAKTAIEAINVILKYALQMPSRQESIQTLNQPSITVNVTPSIVDAQKALDELKKSRQKTIELKS